ncbi:MAG: hypothetical protein MMC23_005992 [Stictis urceolatum]|nr:hypothetical protein [Stictis urceolata]
MASASSIPRFLAPRLFLDPSRAILRRLPTQTRHASTNPPKPRVLEKPAKFNPPSHPQRLQRKIPRHYGPDLTAQERHVQQTKQYPAMMPPDGSWMRWFLTNRSIHMYITLSILASLTILTLSSEFKRTSPYASLLPTWGYLFTHPISGMAQVIDVYKQHTLHVSQEAAELRKKKLDDVRKRKAYRVAHGLEEADVGIQPDGVEGDVGRAAVKGVEREGTGVEGSPVAVGGQEEYVDFEGRRRPVKKWLGIW